MHASRLILAVAATVALIAACGGNTSGSGVPLLKEATLWPFGAVKEQPPARLAPGTVTWQCPGNLRFDVRDIDSGAVWLTLPDRNLRLDRDRASSAARYTRAGTVLEFDTTGAKLLDGSASYSDCKRAG